MKKKKIHVKKIERKSESYSDLGKQLIKNLGDDIFSYQTMQVFLFHVLKQIAEVSRSVKPEDYSIEKACEEVLKYLGLTLEATVSRHTDSGWVEIKRRKKSKTEKFCENIIGIDKVPAHAYKLLVSKVYSDLNSISELIKWYEAQDCIKKYIKDDEIPKSHEHRVIYDFYKRCLNERVKIFNYYLNGLKNRAIQKSRSFPSWFGKWQLFTEEHDDRPYEYAREFSRSHFDCRAIDKAGHRVGAFYSDEEEKLYDLYSKNKTAFYRLYFKRKTVEEHFRKIKYHLSYLPLRRDRSPIFNELERLFKAKRWISFYALALPQVEGLFSEMNFAIDPEKDSSQKSLTYKVKVVRPFHELSTKYFDYYQYHIPLLRNKFSHTGYEDDFKLKSYDLFVDLSHLLEVFYELDNPLVKIKKLHSRRNFEDFLSIREFADYFRLLTELKAKQKIDLKEEIVEFEKDFLNRYCTIEHVCYQILQNLPNLISELTEHVNLNFNDHDIHIDFQKLSKAEINNLLKEKNNKERLNDCFSFKNEAIETILHYYVFMENQNKFLPSLQPDIKEILNKVHFKHKKTLHIISYANQCLKIEMN